MKINCAIKTVKAIINLELKKRIFELRSLRNIGININSVNVLNDCVFFLFNK